MSEAQSCRVGLRLKPCPARGELVSVRRERRELRVFDFLNFLFCQNTLTGRNGRQEYECEHIQKTRLFR